MEFEDSLVRDLLVFQKFSKTEGYRDPFTLPFPGKSGCVPDEIGKKFPNLDAAFGATVSFSLTSEYSMRLERLGYAVGLCESPIEARFLLSLVCSCAKHDLSIVIINDEDEPIYFAETNARMEQKLYVCPQKQLGAYRVDFFLNLVFNNPQVEVARMVGKADPPSPLIIQERLVIECDGHDFHEKTAAQASRDKNRDRELLNAGYPVMRFTGVEIISSPLKCSDQIMKWAFPIEPQGSLD
jgi:Protein of unknown function (DUF559)